MALLRAHAFSHGDTVDHVAQCLADGELTVQEFAV